ncbi:pickpocket 20 [Musca autumnalis]|uniref:pickpocket 20 n=1 Tax=Musca autumnalis TaxID=221902 RepID=UPI003CF214F3
MIWHTDLKGDKPLQKEALLTPKKVLSEKEADAEEEKTLMDLLRLYWQQYCEKSTIHGVRYIYDPSLRSIERLIWSALVITCVTLTCIAYGMLAERYSAQKLQTVVENSQYPVYQIPFPAVGVCPNNHINWGRFEAAKSTFLPANADHNVAEVFTTFVGNMESLAFGQFHSFAEMDDVNLELLDGIDVTNLTHFMSIRCEDIFVKGQCFWRRVPFNCCSMFIMEKTEHGFCFVFNSILSPESKQLREKNGRKFYPYHNSKAGQGSGLGFQIKLNNAMKKPDSKLDDTITILIKRPEQLSNNGYTISAGTETYVIVRPEITESSKDIRPLKQEQRNCFFEDENSLKNYQVAPNVDKELILNNCVNVCHEEHLRKYCNCTLPQFFLSTDPTVETCRASQFRCLAKHNDIFGYDKRLEEDAYFSSAKPGMTCSCLIPCNIIEYYTSLTTLPFNAHKTKHNPHEQYYKIDVHYQSEVVIKYRTSLEFTSIDLIANFGGVFGLCLGASMVSAVELFYYLTVGLALYLYDNNYYGILKQHIRDLRMKWISGIKETLNEEYGNGTSLKRKTTFVPKRPQQKSNKW